MLVRDLAHYPRQIGEVVVAKQEFPQWIAGSRIEACRYQHQFGLYFVRRSHQLLLKRTENLFASGARWKWTIQRHAIARAFPALAPRAGSWIPGRLMRAE